MELFRSLEEKLKDRYGKAYIENYGISLALLGLQDGNWMGTALSLTLWTYYLTIYLYTYHHCLYVQVDRELSEEAEHYAVTIVACIGYILAFRLMAGRIADLVRFLDNETFRYGDTLDPVTIKDISEIYGSTQRRKLAARYYTIVVGVYSLYHFFLDPIISGRLSMESEDVYITRSSLLMKYSLFDARNGIGWFLDFLLDSIFIFSFFLVYTAVDPTFICFAEDSCEQLAVLNVAIKNVYRRARYVYKEKHGREVDSYNSPEFGDCLARCLNESVQHHVTAITCCRKLSRAFTAPVFVVFFTSTIIFCHEVIQLSENQTDRGDLLDAAANVIADLINSFLYAYYGERLLQANLDVNELVYEMDWESSSVAMKPYLSIMQSYTISTTVKLTALGFFDYNYVGFSNILQTAYSYFNILSATREPADP